MNVPGTFARSAQQVNTDEQQSLRAPLSGHARNSPTFTSTATFLFPDSQPALGGYLQQPAKPVFRLLLWPALGLSQSSTKQVVSSKWRTERLAQNPPGGPAYLVHSSVLSTYAAGAHTSCLVATEGRNEYLSSGVLITSGSPKFTKVLHMNITEKDTNRGRRVIRLLKL